MFPTTDAAQAGVVAAQTLRAVFADAVHAVGARDAVLGALRIEAGRLQAGGQTYDLADYRRIVVVGAGKAAAGMAQAVESLLGARIASGLIVVKHGHARPLSFIEQVEAAHPVPDEAGAVSAQRILEMARQADARTLLICLLTGGASALLAAPIEGVTLSDKQQTTALLLNSGASIAELNAVRKHLSAIKGGRLAQAAYPARVLALMLSDVIGDPPDVIASGPTAPDASQFADAWAVVARYGLQDKLPIRVVDYLRRGLAGDAPETVKAGDEGLATTQNLIVASNRLALEAARRHASLAGWPSRIVTAELGGEAREVASSLAQLARAELAQMAPGERRCLLFGGETTVTVRGAGRGGRNQELALAFALAVDGLEGVSLLSGGTDGGDGPTDAAGALVDGATAARARRVGLAPEDFLACNDSCTFFQSLDAATGSTCHLITGPTDTNVMDVLVLLLARR